MRKQKASAPRRLNKIVNGVICLTFPAALCVLVSCKQKQEYQGSPRISYDRTSIEIGDIKKDTIDHVYEFKYSNMGNGILKMEEVSTSCFCTTAKFSDEELAPGETGTLTVVLNLRDVSTQMGMLREFYVKTNASRVPDTLSIIGNVVK